MDTKLKNFSHSIITKIIVFIIMITCLTTAMAMFFKVAKNQDGEFDIVFEDSYYSGDEYSNDSREIKSDLNSIISKYKSEENILAGESIDKDSPESREYNLYEEFQYNSKFYNPNLTEEENYEEFEEVYKDKLTEIKEELIQEDLREYNNVLQNLKTYEGIIYYASNGKNEITNSPNTLYYSDNYFREFPSYIIIDENEKTLFPEEIGYNNNYNLLLLDDYDGIISDKSEWKIYIGFTEEYLDSHIKEWKENKEIVTNNLYQIGAFFLGFLLLFIYLALIIGRKSFRDKEVHLNRFDKLYSDINIGICIAIVGVWAAIMSEIYDSIGEIFVYQWNWNMYTIFIPITLIAVALEFICIISMIKHLKNRTFLKHTLIFTIFHKFFSFIKSVYDSGSIGVKIVVIAIVYPLLVVATFFMFPVTIGVGVWLAFKQVKKFKALKEGVEKIKAGDLNYNIETDGKGELRALAMDINDIGNGLKQAVDNEVKSQRLKTELITNVSHDIRTPLTSIITYVDLLKNEVDSSKREEYIEILEQKSQRLKVLTDDLFQAAKASSGNIPVNLEKIDIVSLITQGLGEINDKILDAGLIFKINHPQNKVFIMADGNLFWRALDNLLNNIFKYALKGSRVYIDIEELQNKVCITIKNMSAYELNISSDELMERFKRGDESRSSEGSGLGLSIAKSLVDIQKGNFKIEIDGDLFKAIIEMPK
ncbi:HAMP domain-containing sensor histidine kinase [Clostridium sp. DL1XJH146]